MGPFSLKSHVKPIGMNIVDGWMDGWMDGRTCWVCL
jgi:hypothetical protein